MQGADPESNPPVDSSLFAPGGREGGGEGGEGGGTIVSQGTVEEVARDKNSITGKFLKKVLK